MRIIDFKHLLEEMSSLVSNHNETLLVMSDKTSILYGVDEFNNPNNLPTFNTHSFGGVIVNFDKDVCLVHFKENDYSYGENLMNNLTEWFKSKRLNATRDGNDVLVEGNKVASYMSANIKGTIYTAAHISVKVDLDIIKTVCIKPMLKTPKGLSDYGLSQEEVIKHLQTNY